MVSFPHFYLGDPRLLEEVEGLNPDPEKHDFYLDVHEVLCAGVDRGSQVRDWVLNVVYLHILHINGKCICSHITYGSTELHLAILLKADVTLCNWIALGCSETLWYSWWFPRKFKPIYPSKIKFPLSNITITSGIVYSYLKFYSFLYLLALLNLLILINYSKLSPEHNYCPSESQDFATQHI